MSDTVPTPTPASDVPAECPPWCGCDFVGDDAGETVHVVLVADIDLDDTGRYEHIDVTLEKVGDGPAEIRVNVLFPSARRDDDPLVEVGLDAGEAARLAEALLAAAAMLTGRPPMGMFLSGGGGATGPGGRH